jgi:hypothetical protein
MEPRLSADLRSSTNLDLTPCVLKDLGWELARGGSCAEDVPAYAEILVSASALDLGRTVPGKATSFGVRVENPGKAPLQIGLRGESDGPEAPFSLASDTCSGKALEQDEGCVLEVLFAPTQTGTFDGKFVIPSNDPSNPALPITLTASADSGDSAAGATGNEATSAETGTTESGGSGGNDVGDATNPFGNGSSAPSGGGGTIGPAVLLLLCATGILRRRRLRRTG